MPITREDRDLGKQRRCSLGLQHLVVEADSQGTGLLRQAGCHVCANCKRAERELSGGEAGGSSKENRGYTREFSWGRWALKAAEAWGGL